MSAHLLPEELRKREHPLHVLFIGEALAEVKSHFKRADEIVRCEHTDNLLRGIDMVVLQAKARPFDCVIVDMRHQSNGSPMDLAGLASLNAVGTLALLVMSEAIATYSQIAGIDELLVHPVKRMDLVETVINSVRNEAIDQPQFVEIPRGFSSSQPMSSDILVSGVAAEPVVHGQIDRAMKALEEIHAPAGSQTAPTDATEQRELKKASAIPNVSEPEIVEAKETAETSVENESQPVEQAVDDASSAATEPKPVEKQVETEVAEPAAEPVAETQEQEAEKSAVTKGFESSLSKIAEADQQIWQRFVPLVNFFYKKLAIIVLTSLFLTFVAYGAMIVFFMGSSSWSLPFELSRGHVLVEKVDRDLSSMSLRRNQVRQDLTVARAEGVTAERELRDGKLQLALTQRTIEEELLLQNAQRLEIRQHIVRLKEIISDFNALNGKGGFAKNLESAYQNRLITRKSLNSGTLAVLETMHRIATVQNEVSLKQLELRRVNRRVEFLRSLKAEIDQPELRVVTSAGSDLAHLAREVIEAKNRISTAEKAIVTVGKRLNRLENSHDVISANISSLEATPAARARKKPVMVLFVPYQNTASMRKGTSLHSCVFSIILCSHVGEVGDPVEGETTAVHPLFGKPLRGNFVEAEFVDADSVKEELMHAGRGPLWF